MSFKDMLNSIFVSEDETIQVVNNDNQTYDSVQDTTQYMNEENVSVGSDEATNPASFTEKRNNVININDGKKRNMMMQIVVPRVYGEAERVGQQLLEGKGLILNFSHMSDPDARRFIDYLAGIVYAVGGDMQRVATDVFLAVPQNMEIEGLYDELDDKQQPSKQHRSNSVWQRKGQED